MVNDTPDSDEELRKRAAEEEARYIEQQKVFFASVSAERNRFITSATEESKSYDQTILTFSAGAIALSLTFIEKIAPVPICQSLLYVSWIMFGLAVISVIASFLISQKAFSNEIEYLDRLWNAAEGRQTTLPKRDVNRHTTATRRLNISSGLLFVGGIAFLIAFGWENSSPKKDPVGTMKGKPIKIEITGEVMPTQPIVTGTVIEVQRGTPPTPALLTTAPQAPSPAPAPSTAPSPTATPTGTTKK